ncbi:hypothetical protein [uncultured Friedmanniella sp.]|uniref:hypothetical protein n=1 Tax=uncultured Friedmanniella sp. TaxID=335381 RepID=UPI0035CC306E
MTDAPTQTSAVDDCRQGHVSPRNGRQHKGAYEECVWCGPPAREIERDAAKKLQTNLARTMLDAGRTIHETAYIVPPDLWDKAVKRLERREGSDPAGLLEAVLTDLAIPYVRIQP